MDHACSTDGTEWCPYLLHIHLPLARPQDQSDDRIQETLLVGYECKESTSPQEGNI